MMFDAESRPKGRAWVILAPVLALGVALVLLAPVRASAMGDWGLVTTSRGQQVHIAWQTDGGAAARYEVFTLPVPIDARSAWCATSDGKLAGVTVGEPDGNPNQFECNFGAYLQPRMGEAGVTTTTPMPCDGVIGNQYSLDGSTFVAEQDITSGDGCKAPPPVTPPPVTPPPVLPPSVSTSGSSSTKARGATVIVDPGIRVLCPTAGSRCSADESARVTVTAATGKSKTKQVLIGSAHVTISAGTATEVTFKLNTAGVKLLRTRKHLRVTVTVISRAAHAKPITTTKKITISAPVPKHRSSHSAETR